MRLLLQHQTVQLPGLIYRHKSTRSSVSGFRKYSQIWLFIMGLFFLKFSFLFLPFSVIVPSPGVESTVFISRRWFSYILSGESSDDWLPTLYKMKCFLWEIKRLMLRSSPLQVEKSKASAYDSILLYSTWLRRVGKTFSLSFITIWPPRSTDSGVLKLMFCQNQVSYFYTTDVTVVTQPAERRRVCDMIYSPQKGSFSDSRWEWGVSRRWTPGAAHFLCPCPYGRGLLRHVSMLTSWLQATVFSVYGLLGKNTAVDSYFLGGFSNSRIKFTLTSRYCRVL